LLLGSLATIGLSAHSPLPSLEAQKLALERSHLIEQLPFALTSV